MPRKSQKLVIEVNEGSSIDGYRSLDIYLRVERALIELSDLVSREGGVEKLEKVIEAALKDAVSLYIDGGKTFFKKAIAARVGKDGEGIRT